MCDLLYFQLQFNKTEKQNHSQKPNTLGCLDVGAFLALFQERTLCHSLSHTKESAVFGKLYHEPYTA